MSTPQGLLSAREGVHLQDHFLSNDSVADAAVGALGWEIVTIGNAATYAYQTAQPTGVLRGTTAATADGDGSALRLFTDALVLKPGFWCAARIRHPVELASLNFRVGLDDSVTATRPTVGVTVEGDAGVLTCRADSADHGDESEAVTGHPDLTSGTTLVVAEWVDILMVGSGRANAQGGPDEIDFFINDEHVSKLPCNIDDDEEVEPKFAFWQDSGGADAVAIEIDYWEFFQPLGARS